MYLIQVQVCPEHNFLIPRPFSPNSTSTLPFANWFWKCTWFRFRYVQSTTSLFRDRFHLIRHQLYPLPTNFENVPDSGSGMSRAQLPNSPNDFHLIWQQPHPLPTDFENVPDSGSGRSNKYHFFIPWANFHHILQNPIPFDIHVDLA